MLEKAELKDTVQDAVHDATGLSREQILRDFEISCISREASLLARKEVLTGKAKFGIIGDGKEIPQVALAHVFERGDFRSGYYRDQTLLFALGLSSVEDFFAQLYADTDNDPFSRGRQMNSHFATPTIDTDGAWTQHTDQYNISSDISSTAGQMARGLGLALASKKYRELNADADEQFSRGGREVCFTTIGDASTSEGVFWETVNAAGVMQVPLAILVWDDGYGISVPKEYQTTKGSISDVLNGFQKTSKTNGLEIHKVKGWDYPALVATFRDVVGRMRESHTPVLIHVEELTQPQGHSTSGSHERYKSKSRLQWEREHDCLELMKLWMIDEGLATEEELDLIWAESKRKVKQARDKAWKAYTNPIKQRLNELTEICNRLESPGPETQELIKELGRLLNPQLSEILALARRIHFQVHHLSDEAARDLRRWVQEVEGLGHASYEQHLYSKSPRAALNIPVVPPRYEDQPQKKNGYEILNAFFDQSLAEMPNLLAFGEDVGHIGDVNQGFAGMQEKHGEFRVFDTGIREWTIMGQAIGLAMRGLRPIAEIQYLDYLIYGLEPLTDDLATLRWRSAGQQMAPAIIRTRGHRLEGIWHAGSPLGMILNALRGMYVLVPRNMTQAVGMYRTMLQSDDPALMIECLNGYRLKEEVPENFDEFTVPLGVPEVLCEGSDITLVTYGSCVRVAEAGVKLLAKKGISVELVDVQTLLPFDLEHRILQSLKKTNRVLFMDEDVPGGATAFMMREVLEVQGGYRYLDSPPATLTAKAHRPPYGSDGDYFSKPNIEDVYERIYRIMHEADPGKYPNL